MAAPLPANSDQPLLDAYSRAVIDAVDVVAPGVVSVHVQPIASIDDLYLALTEARIGSRATLGILRDTQRIDFDVTIVERSA